jgi:hypothetical protein
MAAWAQRQRSVAPLQVRQRNYTRIFCSCLRPRRNRCRTSANTKIADPEIHHAAAHILLDIIFKSFAEINLNTRKPTIEFSNLAVGDYDRFFGNRHHHKEALLLVLEARFEMSSVRPDLKRGGCLTDHAPSTTHDPPAVALRSSTMWNWALRRSDMSEAERAGESGQPNPEARRISPFRRKD